MKKLKIRARLLAGYIIVVAIMLIISVVVITQMIGVRGQLESFRDASLQASNSIKECRLMSQYVARNVREIALTTDPAKIQESRKLTMHWVPWRKRMCWDRKKKSHIKV